MRTEEEVKQLGGQFDNDGDEFYPIPAEHLPKFLELADAYEAGKHGIKTFTACYNLWTFIREIFPFLDDDNERLGISGTMHKPGICVRRHNPRQDNSSPDSLLECLENIGHAMH